MRRWSTFTSDDTVVANLLLSVMGGFAEFESRDLFVPMFLKNHCRGWTASRRPTGWQVGYRLIARE